MDEFTKEYFTKDDDSILAFTYTYGGVRMSKPELLEGVLKGHDEIFDWQPKKLWDHYYKDGIYFIDHHQSHAAYAFINSGFEQADKLAIDGIGNRYRCCFFDKDNIAWILFWITFVVNIISLMIAAGKNIPEILKNMDLENMDLENILQDNKENNKKENNKKEKK